MARKQRLQNFELAVTTTAIPLMNSSKEVTSVIIQNPLANSDDLVVGNSSGVFMHIYPGKELEIRGDNLDHGTSGYLNLNEIYVKINSGTGSAVIGYLGDWGAVN